MLPPTLIPQKKNYISQQGLSFDFDRIRESSRNPSNIRVVQPKLLYVIGLQSNICTQETLCDPKYFGKYGRVKKIVINKNGGLNKKFNKKATCSAYMTYDNELSCSLALVSMFEFKYSESAIRSCFGYSKYCESYYYRKGCYKKDCVYLHEIMRDREIVAGGECDRDRDIDQDNFYKEFELALKLVYKNRKEIMDAYRKQEQSEQGFPTVYQSMKILVRENIMSIQQYMNEWGRQKQDFVKCHTEQTQTSPSKQQSDAQKPAFQEQFWGQNCTSKSEENQRTVKSSTCIETVKEQTQQQKICHKILRTVRNRNLHSRSRFEFAGNTEPNSQMKSLFERQLGYKISI